METGQRCECPDSACQPAGQVTRLRPGRSSPSRPGTRKRLQSCLHLIKSFKPHHIIASRRAPAACKHTRSRTGSSPKGKLGVTYITLRQLCQHVRVYEAVSRSEFCRCQYAPFITCTSMQISVNHDSIFLLHKQTRAPQSRQALRRRSCRCLWRRCRRRQPCAHASRRRSAWGGCTAS